LVAFSAQVIGRDAHFAAVGTGYPGLPQAARVVAFAGTLDLDHVGAQVSQVLVGPGAGENARQGEHADVRQGAASLGIRPGRWSAPVGSLLRHGIIPQLAKAAMPVMARPRIRACTSCVPS